jgi:cyclopropane fatty-acyl-phospholipid synthase-like methyltransferase
MSQFLTKYEYIFNTMREDMVKAKTPLDRMLHHGGNVLEYGAGTGESAYRFAREYPQSSVTGVDVHVAYENVYKSAEREINAVTHPKNLAFHNMGQNGGSHAITTDDPFNIDRSVLTRSFYDFCFTWCVFEHVDMSIMNQTLADLHATLVPGGVMYLKINPLYYSTRGSHLSAFIPEPWAHLLYDESELKTQFFKAAAAAKNKQAELIWHQYLTLNRITADELKERVERAGFTIYYEHRLYEGRPPAALLTRYTEESLRNKDIVFACRKD